MNVIAHILPSDVTARWATSEGALHAFPEDGTLEVVLDTERSGDIPTCAWITEGGRIGGAVLRAKVTYPDSPVIIRYNLDAKERDKIVMLGLHEATQRQVRDAVKVLAAFKGLLRAGGRPPLTEEEIQEQADLVDRIEVLAERLGISLEQALAREMVPRDTYYTYKRRLKNRVT